MNTKSLNEVLQDLCQSEAPLNERLAAFSAVLRVQAIPYADAYDVLVARLKAGEAGANAPGEGDDMPDFALPDANGSLVTLDALTSNGPVVVSFNRGHWCEYCAIELSAFQQAAAEFKALGAQVVAIMPETLAFIAKAQARTHHEFPIVSDVDNSFALSMGLVIWLGETVKTLFQQDGLDLVLSQGPAAWFVPIPATFVVGPNLTIIARYVDPDFRRRMDIDEIIAALKRAPLKMS